MSERDRARSVLYGLALGDSLSWSVRHLPRGGDRDSGGRLVVQEPSDPARVTTETWSTVSVTEALVEADDANLGELAEVVRRQFAPRGGSVASIAPVGYLYQHDPDRLREVAYAVGSAAHIRPAAAIGTAYLIKLALDGASPDQYIRETLAFTNSISDEFDDAMLRIGHAIGWTDEQAAIAHIGVGRTEDAAVAMAAYCAIRHSDDYVRAVCLGAYTPSHSDPVGSLAGGLVAARLGPGAIPREWVARLEVAGRLTDLADRLAARKMHLYSK